MRGRGQYQKKQDHSRRSRTPEKDDRRRPLRSPSPGGHRRHDHKKSVNFKYPTAQTAESSTTAHTEQDDMTDNDGVDPDLRETHTNDNTYDHDTEKALNTWHSKQVMGSANMAVANTAHTSRVSVTDADIKAWRASNVDCSEWMTDDNIECVISCERSNKIESLVKKKLERRTNRVTSDIIYNLKQKAMGAEPPQRRPFAREIQAREAHQRSIQKTDQERSSPKVKRRIEEDNVESQRNKKQRQGAPRENQDTSNVNDTPNSDNTPNPHGTCLTPNISSQYDANTATESPSTKRRRVETDVPSPIIVGQAHMIYAAGFVEEPPPPPAVEPVPRKRILQLKDMLIGDGQCELKGQYWPKSYPYPRRDRHTHYDIYLAYKDKARTSQRFSDKMCEVDVAWYPDWITEAPPYPDPHYDYEEQTMITSPLDSYDLRLSNLDQDQPEFDYTDDDDEQDRLGVQWMNARAKEIQDGEFAWVRRAAGIIPQALPLYCITANNGIDEDNMTEEDKLRQTSRSRGIRDYHDYGFDNIYPSGDFNRSRLEWSRYHHQGRLTASWPYRLPTVPRMRELRHFYSYETMIGVADHNHFTRTREGRRQADAQGVAGGEPADVFRDIRIPQIQYTASILCHYTWLSIDYCRCLNCLTLHTACLPIADDLEADEVCNVRVIVTHDDKDLDDTPVLRKGVVNASEKRPEFIVYPFDDSMEPRLARRPRVYRVQEKSSTTYPEPPLQLDRIKHNALYAEFEDSVDPEVRYVIGVACRYHQTDIIYCPCGICKQLRDSLYMDTTQYYPQDDYHYVWCSSYDLRAPHVLNSLIEHASLGMNPPAPVNLPQDDLDDDAYFEDRQASTVSSNSEISGGESRAPFFHCNVVVFDCNSKFDAFKDHSGTGNVPRPFGDKDIVSDSGATKHMFHDRDQFSSYRDTENHFVRVAEGTLVPVLGMGDVGPLKGVLHVPSLVYDLVSESCLDRDGKWCITGDGVKTFYERTPGGRPDYAAVFLVARLCHTDMYIVNPMYLGMSNNKYNYKCYDALASKTEALDLLHKVLGHISIDRIQELVKSGHVAWNHESPPVNFRKFSSPCIACALAKSKRQSHVKRIRVPITPGSLIYVDVWGPCDTISLINESVYTIGFIDAATKKAWLYQRRKKSDILECLKHFYETVIIKRRASHGLKDFVVQSDNGEFKSDAILKFLHSVGGDRRTCCAYTPEIMAFIERLWGIINSMASAMLIDKGLPEEFLEFAQNYALDIYNNIPPTRTPKGQDPKSPNEKFEGKNEDTSLYKSFGCRAFAHIPKQTRRKNHNARAHQGMFVGLDRTSYPGYMIYSPELHTVYVTGDATFQQLLRYDGSLSKYNAYDTNKKREELPVESVERYKYLVGTSHVDPDNGLLYKVTKIEEKHYRGQGTYIVAYRAQVLSDGRISTKCDTDAYHVRDIEEYYNTYMSMIQERYPEHSRSTRSMTSKTQVPVQGDGGASVQSLGKLICWDNRRSYSKYITIW